VRQKFTGYEADYETGLNFAQARYQSSVQGRFTSADPLSGNPHRPQSWNRYAYVLNNPLKLIDPTGMSAVRSTDDSSVDVRGHGVGALSLGQSWTRDEALMDSVAETTNESIALTPEGKAGQLADSQDQLVAGADPQNPGGSYQTCKGLASIPEGAANDILSVSRQEGTDPTLIAVTMKEESSFGVNLDPNPRVDRNTSAVTGFDVGPMQVATDIWNKSPYTNGLPKAFSNGIDDVGRPIFGRLLPFTGDIVQNMRLGARALNASSGWRGRPSNVSARADAAGIFRAGSRNGSYWVRVNEFNRFQPAYDRFFNCMQGKP
jgi:RHS repeat-associated protein